MTRVFAWALKFRAVEHVCERLLPLTTPKFSDTSMKLKLINRRPGETISP